MTFGPAAMISPTVASQKATGAFMQLTSKGGVSLVGVASPAASIVEIHEMVMDKDVMKMRPVPRLEVQPGKPLELRPGSYHVMLIDLKKPLAKGEIVPITLQVEGRDKKIETVDVNAEVRELTASAADWRCRTWRTTWCVTGSSGTPPAPTTSSA